MSCSTIFCIAALFVPSYLRGGSLFLCVSHSCSFTLKVNGGSLAGSLRTFLLKIVLYFVINSLSLSCNDGGPWMSIPWISDSSFCSPSMSLGIDSNWSSRTSWISSFSKSLRLEIFIELQW